MFGQPIHALYFWAKESYKLDILNIKFYKIEKDDKLEPQKTMIFDGTVGKNLLIMYKFSSQGIIGKYNDEKIPLTLMFNNDFSSKPVTCLEQHANVSYFLELESREDIEKFQINAVVSQICRYSNGMYGLKYSK
jgi:hypothetical protein